MRSWQYGDPLDVLISAEQGKANRKVRDRLGCSACRYRDVEAMQKRRMLKKGDIWWGGCVFGHKPGPRGFCPQWKFDPDAEGEIMQRIREAGL